MPSRDDFTSTVDGAAAHAALFSDGGDDDRPSLADVAEPPGPRRPVELCRAVRDKDGVVSWCSSPAHPPSVPHVPSPWTMTSADYRAMIDNPPF